MKPIPTNPMRPGFILDMLQDHRRFSLDPYSHITDVSRDVDPSLLFGNCSKLLPLILDVFEGRVTPIVKSSDVTTFLPSPGSVGELSRLSFTSLVDASVDVLVVFGAPWCSRCDLIQTQLQRLVNDLNTVNSTIVVTLYDLHSNDWPFNVTHLYDMAVNRDKPSDPSDGDSESSIRPVELPEIVLFPKRLAIGEKLAPVRHLGDLTTRSLTKLLVRQAQLTDKQILQLNFKPAQSRLKKRAALLATTISDNLKSDSSALGVETVSSERKESSPVKKEL